MQKILLAELPVSESQELFRNLLVKIIDPAVAWEFRQTSLDVVGFLGEEMVCPSVILYTY